MYTKGMQDFMDMTADDFEKEQVLDLDGDAASNFAVYNDKTVLVACRDGANQMTDNGGGTFTVRNADKDIASLKAGDTFSYTDADGTVSIIKVKDIQVDGATVTITEDEDVDLEDVFDYVKIEGGYQPEGTDEQRASIGFENSGYSKTERFDWTKNLGSGSLTASLKASGALTAAPYIKVYLALTYQYVELTLTMTASFDCSASGRLARQSVDLLPKELSFTPVAGVTVTFMPRLEFEASGNVSFSATLETVVGFSCDGNGLVNRSSGPQLTKCDFHIDATVYLGLGLEPGVHVGIAGRDLGSLSLDLQVGAQITGKMDVSGVQGNSPHLCKKCIAGDITGRLDLSGTLSLIFIGEKTASLAHLSSKLTDFYYSFDYNEFGWTTCPHIESKPVAQGTCGQDLKWKLNEEGVLTVNGTGDMTSWSSSSDVPWYKEREKITSVVLESGVTSVGAYAFNWWYSSSSDHQDKLTEIEIPEGVTDIGDHAFQACANLFNINIPKSVTVIGNYAFSGCISLPADLEISEEATAIGDGAFSGCTSLRKVDIPAKGIRIGSSAFERCSYLLSVDIGGGFINSSAFSGCSGLTTVMLGSGVTGMGPYVFQNCTSLKNITIPDNVKKIDNGTFEGCTGLSEIDLGTNLIEIGQEAFEGCTHLANVTFPLNLKKIDCRAFKGCSMLADIHFTGNCPEILHDVFWGVVATAYHPADNETWGTPTSNYSGTLTWVAYDPASLSSVSPEDAASIGQEGIQSTAPEIQEPILGPNDLQQEDPSGVRIAAEPPTVQAMAPVRDSSAGTLSGGSRTEEFTGLMPKGVYVLLVSKDLEGSSPLSPANLLYIAQVRADESGSLVLSYVPRTDESAKAGVYGPDLVAKDIGGCAVTLSETSYVYNGKARLPEVIVKDGQSVLTEGTDYTISYRDHTNAGTASVLVTGKGLYTGTHTVRYTIEKADNSITASSVTRTASGKAQSFSIGARAIGGARLSYQSDTRSVAVDSRGRVTIAKNFAGRAVITITAAATADFKKTEKKITVTVKAAGPSRPAKTRLTSASVSAKKRKMTVRWKRAAKVTGYQIQYCTSRKFGKGARKLQVAGGKKTSRTIGRLAKGKKYYVRIRTYNKAAGKVVYSGWSKVRRTKMKK